MLSLSLRPCPARALALLAGCAIGGLALGCNGFPAPTNDGLAPGQRLITGELLAPTGSELGDRDVALQLAAISFPTGDCSAPTTYLGAAFDPAPNGATRSTVPFTMTVPCDQTVYLRLQRAAAGASRAEVIGPIVFPSSSGGPLTARIPGIDPSLTNGPCADPPGGQLLGRRINLGQVALPAQVPGPIVIGQDGVGSSQNPLKQVDSDANGVDDYSQGPGMSMGGGADGSDATDGGTTAPLAECDQNTPGIPGPLVSP